MQDAGCRMRSVGALVPPRACHGIESLPLEKKQMLGRQLGGCESRSAPQSLKLQSQSLSKVS